jgi:hypothetical protein
VVSWRFQFWRFILEVRKLRTEKFANCGTCNANSGKMKSVELNYVAVFFLLQGVDMRAIAR